MKGSCLQFSDCIGLRAIANGSNFVFSPISIRAAISLVADKKNTMKDSCLQFADCIGLRAIANGSNVVFSPISIRAAISLVAVGANGATRDQFLQFLGVSTVESLNEVTASLLASVQAENNGFEQDDKFRISFANGIWVDESLSLKQSFEEVAASVYSAATKSVDFAGKPKEAVKEVNQWIESKTSGLLKNIIPPNAINSSTKFILTNALYFKAAWLHTFSLYRTANGPFHLLNGKIIQSPFMSSSEDDQYIASFDHFKVLKLPYKQTQSTRHKFSMLIFLPRTKDGINTLVENAVSSPNFITSHVPYEKVLAGNFKVPKFKVSSQFEASEMLQELGLVIPFSGSADFTEMVNEVDGMNISGVIHGASVEVNEHGTEASAATVISMRKLCFRMGARVDFVVDHPFLFAIVEEMTGAVLFMGHVVDPSEMKS